MFWSYLGALEQSRVVPDDEWEGPNAMSIRGRILDKSCRPVAGAKVEGGGRPKN